MGCATSKQKRCRHCQAPYSPVPRSYSMHVVHPPQQKGDSYHMVALTSTTLGTLALDSSVSNHKDSNENIEVVTGKGEDRGNGILGDKELKNKEFLISGTGAVGDMEVMRGECLIGGNGAVDGKELKSKECLIGANGVVDDKELKNKVFSLGLIEAKAWSNVIQGKIPKVAPKTPIMTPPGEPETINTWELMAGLEDVSPSHFVNHHFRSFSFDVSRETCAVADSPKLMTVRENTPIPSDCNSKPLWLQMANEESDSRCPEFDPEVISTFRKSLEELSPNHPFYIKPSDMGNSKQLPSLGSGLTVDVSDTKMTNLVDKDSKHGKEKVVLYFTSLRGIRKTYEDCCYVKVILKGLGVRLDERDVSMHSGFKEELRELLGEGFRGGLPRVFIGSKHIGGAEEIKRMHEEGQLEKIIEVCEMVSNSIPGAIGACEACGDIRFVPCETCSGSCKIYYEAEEEEHGELEGGEDDCEFGFQRCPDCNENGLIRCPICCH
ncbi:hypothetical protein K2173_013971 [Erythroxylum novogranatense]|uniref:Glutaredoxin domain-containing protein n=1 Tax=Erythroxylum novogranatense TaxID=1862640 RepID=A0AAV8SCV4_9ROSI|nr:hypothetical protein K2173_013971 [Erythroxylum novogranatense]